MDLGVSSFITLWSIDYCVMNSDISYGMRCTNLLQAIGCYRSTTFSIV